MYNKKIIYRRTVPLMANILISIAFSHLALLHHYLSATGQ